MIDRRGIPLAALVLAALVAACGPATPSATPTTTPAPSPTAAAPSSAATSTATQPATTPAGTETAGTPACETGDLKASHGLVEGAAGSVLSQIVLETGTACSVDATPILGLKDASGAGVVGATSGSGSVDLAAGTAYTSDVRLANWCGADPVFPLTLVLGIDGAELAVTGTSFPEEGALPPCLASGGPTLEATPWVPSP